MIGNLIFDFEVSRQYNRLISPRYRFYIFVCSLCNHGTEFLRKLHMKFEDLVHLLLFNLNKHNNLDYYHVDKAIVPYALDNWHALQLRPTVSCNIHVVISQLLKYLLQTRNMSFSEIKDRILKALNSNEKRFRCHDAESKMKNYCLRVNVPPPVEQLVLPPNGPLVTEKYIKEHFKDKTKIHIIPKR